MKRQLNALLAAVVTAAMVVTACAGGGAGNKSAGGQDAGSGAEEKTKTTAAAAGSGAAGEAEYKDTIVWAQASDVTSMDPHVGKETAAVTVTCNIFSTLVRTVGEGDVEPLLAESWEQLSDTDWKFTIRKGVKFHDGSEMTVEDVKYSLDRAINSNYVAYIVNFIDNVEITDENTIVIHTKAPYAPILSNLGLPFSAIVPKAYIEKNGDEYFQLHPVGTGPYKMVEWNAGESIKLEAFDDYFGGAPKTKNLTMKVVPEAAQRVIAMETGEVDMAYSINANDVKKIEENKNLTALPKPSRTCYNYFFNLKQGPTTDINLRKAICHAVDRQLIIDTILSGTASVAKGMIAPSVAGYVECQEYEYDLEKAKEYMAKSAYPDGCKLTMIVNDNQERIEICQAIQSMLKELNIDVEIKSYEQATYLQCLNNAEHDMGFSAWITSTGDADYTYYPCYHSTQKGPSGNRSFFGDPEADRLIEEGRATTDIEERKKVYDELNQVIYDNCTQLFVAHPVDTVAVNNKVKGFVMNDDGYHRLEFVQCEK